ncbi:hypothetical protein M407DRAFT_14276 [Tulasnella calospora MUT 4182]|uniref:HhH-GPD domain-containing protein n=1 Tax=Tulasnella calospora MUT 4182 TaxID=1051891 RepID=A0A0C3QS20_9AGAM|nr:hypothetical protein M407DRAFT_14276 [Tulasnella calospora MUT 4182]
MPANSGPVPKADIIPATLSFDFAEAKKHLINADSRFEKLFSKLKCRPYEELDAVEPFHVHRCRGQQISWKAARSIKHKFIRLFDPSLPETPPAPGDKQIDFFPSPHAVAAANINNLRSAGLSARKGEYIMDLATRFSDGRLSAKRLAEGTDEEVYDMLIQVKGIGPWTVEMFSIFSLRRPNILPCGDLGVQKGVLRWVLASHSPKDAAHLKIAPERLPGNSEEDEHGVGASSNDSGLETPVASPAKEANPDEDADGTSILPTPKASTNPPATPKKRGPKAKIIPPTPFTPSVFTGRVEAPVTPIPLPDGLTVSGLKARLAGKKIKKGLYLTPEEMQALTEPWAPYRSIGVWFMWSVIDDGVLS